MTPRTNSGTHLVLTILCCLILFFSFISLTQATHKCIHDSLPDESVVSYVDYGGEHPFELAADKSHKRTAAASSWKKIRIKFVTDKLGSARVKSVLPQIESLLENIFYVYPVPGNLQLRRVCAKYWTQNGEPYVPQRCTQFLQPTCGSDYGSIPTSYFMSEDIYSSFSPNSVISQTSGGAGVADTDMMIFVTDQNNADNCGQYTLAYASSCFRNQFDAPTAGYINVCDIALTGGYSDEELKSVMIHEIFHALGFSGSDFKRYRDGQGRKYSNPTQTYSERGGTSTKLVLEPALSKAREHFGCSSLQGVELENGGGSGTVGSHLERRNYNTEHMVGEILKNPVISPLSLAVLESSNWYRVDYSYAKRISWGHKKGCGFAYESKCLSGTTPTSSFPAHYCTTSQEPSCTVDLKSKAACNLVTHSSNLPSQYQYFSNAKQGGSSSMDYCPIYSPKTSCVLGSVEGSNTRSETFGEGSKCLRNTLSTGGSADSWAGGCYKVHCGYSTDSGTGVATVSSVTVVISASTNVTCAAGEEGASKSVPGLSGQIKCPAVYDDACDVAPVSKYTMNLEGCRFECRNGGKCVGGTCQCPSGYSGDICEISGASSIYGGHVVMTTFVALLLLLLVV